MADEQVLKSTVVLDDEYSSTADKIAKSSKKMSDTVKDSSKSFDTADKSLESLVASMSSTAKQSEAANTKLSKLGTTLRKLKSGKKITVSTNLSAVESEVKSVEKAIQGITGKYANITVTPKVNKSQIKAAESEANKLKKELQELTGKKWDVDLNLSGTATSGAVTGGISSLLSGAIGGTAAGSLLIGGGAAALGAGTVAGVSKIASLGSSREQNMVAMTHFMDGDTDAAKSMLDWASENARVTQFSESEIQSAARRAIQVTEGNADQAKYLTQIAEDMASLTPGKTVMDAMEALADASLGEFERMKEFGFKSNADLFEAAGGDLTKVKSTTGKTIEELFAGGTAAGADTAASKVGTIAGTFESALANVGEKMMNGLSPALDILVGKAEQYAPVLEDALTNVGTTLGNLFNALQPYTPLLSALGTVVGSVVSTAFSIVGTVLNDLVIPAIKWVGEKTKPAFQKAVDAANLVKDALTSLKNMVKSAADALGSVPDKIGSMASSAASTIKSWFSTDKNATGTMSFNGGLTQINENNRGEIVQLPSGSKIYPYQTTQKMLRKALNKSSGTTNNNIFNVNIDARGSNLTNSQVYRLKKEIVNDIVEALDNTVPA